MKTWIFWLGLFALAPALARAAPQLPDHGGHANPAHLPYSGMQDRAIKAFSAQQLSELRAGKGMSLALPAELNNYPGPSHTLELAAALGLRADQKRETQTLLAQMQAEAKNLGEQLIASERVLDRLFRDRTASLASVRAAVADAARIQGELRFAHLQAHVKMAALLTTAQIEKYNALRGYQ